MLARLRLQRLADALSSRYVVVEREVIHRSPILLTPFKSDGLIEVDSLERFVALAYDAAGLRPDQVDTGARSTSSSPRRADASSARRPAIGWRRSSRPMAPAPSHARANAARRC